MSNFIFGPTGSGSSGASSSSGINYISNPDAETNTTGWDTYDDGASATPTDGTGGTAANITLSRTTTAGEILRGTASFEIAKGAADAQGEGWSYDFEIDEVDQGKQLYFSFDYKVSANYSSGDVRCFIYDKDNASLIGALINSDDGDVLAETGTGTKYTGTFVAASDATNYRVIFHITTTNASAYDFFFDNVSMGPAASIPTGIVTPWESFTPTGSWSTNSTWTGHKRRVGDSLEVTGKIALSGAPDTATLTITIPDSLSIDTAKTTADTDNSATFFADITIWDNGTTYYRGGVEYASATSLTFRYQDASAQYSDITQAAPMTFASGDEVFFSFKVPISGWSSGASISSGELLNQISKTKIYRNTSNQTISAATETQVQFNGSDVDTNGAADTASYAVNILTTGYYKLHLQLFLSGVAADDAMVGRVRKNNASSGTQVLQSFSDYRGTTAQVQGTNIVYLEKGDILYTTIDSETDTSYDVSWGDVQSYLIVEQLPNFSLYGVYGQIGYEESTVATAAYSITAGQDRKSVV